METSGGGSGSGGGGGGNVHSIMQVAEDFFVRNLLCSLLGGREWCMLACVNKRWNEVVIKYSNWYVIMS